MEKETKTLEQLTDKELEAEVRRLSLLNESVKLPAKLVLHVISRIKLAYELGFEDGFEKANNQ